MNRATVCLAVARLCGLVLLMAVTLKVHGVTAGGVGQSLGHFSPTVQLAGIEFEAIVGLWLVSGWRHRGAWLAGVGLYGALAGVSLYLVWTGVSSCGYLGRVQISPWASFALDAACLAGLALTRPADLSEWLRTPASSAVRTAAAGVGVVLLIVGSTSPAANRQFARLRGEALILEVGDADAGAAQPGESRWVEGAVENISDRDARLIGGTADCACLATADLPVTIPAGGRAVVRVDIRYVGSPGNFKHSFRWHTDVPTQPQLGVFVSGRVEAGPERH